MTVHLWLVNKCETNQMQQLVIFLLINCSSTCFGRKDARTLLRNNWLTIKSLIVASSWSHIYLLIHPHTLFRCIWWQNCRPDLPLSLGAWSYRHYRTELKASGTIQRTRSNFWMSARSYRQAGTWPYRENRALLQLAVLFYRLATPHSFRASYCTVFLAGDILTSHATRQTAYKDTFLLRTYIKFFFGVYRLLYPEDLEFLRKVSIWGITCHE